MPRVTVYLPSLLANLTGERTVPVTAESVGEALKVLTTCHPALLQAIFDESGALREHVLCFHNKENTRWHVRGLQRQLRPGDRLTLLQAVAGG